MPSYITSTTTTPYSTRFQHPFHFNIPNARTNFYHNSYFPKTVRDWNSLPISAIKAHTVNSFCNQLSLFLLLIIIVMYCNVCNCNLCDLHPRHTSSADCLVINNKNKNLDSYTYIDMHVRVKPFKFIT